MRIAICVVTYKRPDGLKRLLQGLSALHFEDPSPEVRVVVVDNDADIQAARAVCDEARASFRWELEYHLEPRRGIPFARNKAIACAKDAVDFIAFIDDDEVPEPNWLDELIRVQREHDADVVTGPVVSHFTSDVPPWIIKGRFFERRRGSTGTRMDRAFTGNILFRTALFDGMDPWFDGRLAFAGGSDVHFLRRVHRAGYGIVWADDAVAREWVPASRVNAGWIVRRAFRIGTSTAFVEFDLRPAVVAAALVLAIGCYRIASGALLLPIGLVLGRHFLVRQVRYVAYGAGLLAGLTGRRYEEYRQTHGS